MCGLHIILLTALHRKIIEKLITSHVISVSHKKMKNLILPRQLLSSEKYQRFIKRVIPRSSQLDLSICPRLCKKSHLMTPLSSPPTPPALPPKTPPPALPPLHPLHRRLPPPAYRRLQPKHHWLNQ